MKQLLATALQQRFLRYLVVGAANTAFSYGVYALGLWLGAPYALANLISLICGIGVSFYMQGRFVFGNASLGVFPKYLAMWSLLYLLNIGLIKLLLDFGLDAYVAGAVALPFVVVTSYLLQKTLVFARH